MLLEKELEDLVERAVQRVLTRLERPSPGPRGDEMLTTEQVAAEFKRTPGTVRTWAKSGKLKASGKRPLMFRRADVVAFLEAQHTHTHTHTAGTVPTLSLVERAKALVGGK